MAERISCAQAGRYGYSWLSVTELADFNYEQTFTNQRREPPEDVTYREFLGDRYFVHLAVLNALSADNDVRVLFCFQG